MDLKRAVNDKAGVMRVFVASSSRREQTLFIARESGTCREPQE